MKLLYAVSLWLCFFAPPVFAQVPSSPAGQIAPKGWLGVGLEEIPINESKQLGYDHPLVKITIVGADTPAQTAGIQTGDLISGMNGQPLTGVNDLITRIKSTQPGTEITLQRLKNKEEESLIVLLGLRPDDTNVFNRMYLQKPAEPIDIITIDNKEKIDLATHKGKVVMLDFWATWCGPCIASIPSIGQLSTTYKEQGLEVIGISNEELPTIRKFVRRMPVPYTMATYSAAPDAKRYFVSALPTVYLIDKQGVVREIIVGSGKKQELERKIVALLNE